VIASPEPLAVPPPPPVAAAPVVAPAAPTTPAQPPTPLKRGRAPYAVLQVLDKVTADTIRFRAPVGGQVRYKSLVFDTRACESSAADESRADSLAWVRITSQPISAQGVVQGPPKEVFKGWISATSPGLNPVQHPVYDVWLISCTTSPPPSLKR
jgi:hypothetical protein